jgi:hypothetical protein
MMKNEKQGSKASGKAKEEPVNSKRIDYLVTYEVEGSRSKKQRAHAYSKEEAETIVTKKLEKQIAGGEINGFKIISVDVDAPEK